MARATAAILLALGLASCVSTAVRDGGCGRQISEHDYFGVQSVDMEFYAAAFAKMGEPSLYCDAKGAKSWRLTYHPYNKPTVTIRATSDGDARTIRVIKFRVINHDDGEHWTGRVVRDTERRLTASEWEELEAASVAVDFWHKPTEYSLDLCDEDGNRCRIIALPSDVIEGRDKTYHLVVVWPTGNLVELNDTLRRLARLDD